MKNICTIGYGNIALADFMGLLRKFNIGTLVDIRSMPYSKHRPEYRKHNLETEIINAGIKYLYLGDRLGGMPEDRKYYNSDGKINYNAFAEDPLYLEGIRRIVDLSLKKNICLMCAEADPGRCHRSLLVAETLWRLEIESLHILHDGSILGHGDLRTKYGQNQGDLFNGTD